MSAQVSIRNLYYRYDKRNVIDDLSLELNGNDILCLLGASGCGKTTTLKAIAGLVTPNQGEIALWGDTVLGKGVNLPPEQRNIGMMFQDYALFPHLNVYDNIAFGLTHLTKAEIKARVDEMLSLVQLDGFATRYPHQLSGGQQQRVAIARALAYRPKLLLLDEPFSNIDHQVRFQLIADMRAIIKQLGVPAVFVTHSKEEAFAFSDTLAIMSEGKIVQQGTPETLFKAPANKVVAEFLGTGLYINATHLGAGRYKTEFGEVQDAALSNEVSQAHQVNGPDAEPVMLDSVTKGQLYVRPHVLSLEATPGSATVVAKRFMGTHTIYRIQYHAQEVDVAMPLAEQFAVGQAISLSIQSHTVNFFI